MTAQTMSFRYELACKGQSTEKAQDGNSKNGSRDPDMTLLT